MIGSRDGDGVSAGGEPVAVGAVDVGGQRDGRAIHDDNRGAFQRGGIRVAAAQAGDSPPQFTPRGRRGDGHRHRHAGRGEGIVAVDPQVGEVVAGLIDPRYGGVEVHGHDLFAGIGDEGAGSGRLGQPGDRIHIHNLDIIHLPVPVPTGGHVVEADDDAGLSGVGREVELDQARAAHTDTVIVKQVSPCRATVGADVHISIVTQIAVVAVEAQDRSGSRGKVKRRRPQFGVHRIAAPIRVGIGKQTRAASLVRVVGRHGAFPVAGTDVLHTRPAGRRECALERLREERDHAGVRHGEIAEVLLGQAPVRVHRASVRECHNFGRGRAKFERGVQGQRIGRHTRDEPTQVEVLRGGRAASDRHTGRLALLVLRVGNGDGDRAVHLVDPDLVGAADVGRDRPGHAAAALDEHIRAGQRRRIGVAVAQAGDGAPQLAPGVGRQDGHRDRNGDLVVDRIVAVDEEGAEVRADLRDLRDGGGGVKGEIHDEGVVGSHRAGFGILEEPGDTSSPTSFDPIQHDVVECSFRAVIAQVLETNPYRTAGKERGQLKHRLRPSPAIRPITVGGPDINVVAVAHIRAYNNPDVHVTIVVGVTAPIHAAVRPEGESALRQCHLRAQEPFILIIVVQHVSVVEATVWNGIIQFPIDGTVVDFRPPDRRHCASLKAFFNEDIRSERRVARGAHAGAGRSRAGIHRRSRSRLQDNRLRSHRNDSAIRLFQHEGCSRRPEVRQGEGHGCACPQGHAHIEHVRIHREARLCPAQRRIYHRRRARRHHDIREDLRDVFGVSHGDRDRAVRFVQPELVCAVLIGQQRPLDQAGAGSEGHRRPRQEGRGSHVAVAQARDHAFNLAPGLRGRDGQRDGDVGHLVHGVVVHLQLSVVRAGLHRFGNTGIEAQVNHGGGIRRERA
ncbi:MAG: hypothetical protein BWY25_02560 [Chloroflexi bacterium ADurb.Bin222]|nr:MAG: hypothetical protein BWY25_02560 [Chloroflexi bacterium ADurb.Bin222]